uniref:Eisosome protein SEG2 n=1 Tax=Noccaea caerulescens TaxID=107243 RepID=A0A1J3GA30_NOCCA
MGCLQGCFGRRQNRRRQRRRESFQHRLTRISEGSTKDVHLNLRVPIVEEVSNSVVETPKIPEESAKDDRIDFRVPTDEEVPEISVIPITDICDKAEEKHSPSPTRKRVTFDSNVKTYEHIAVEESIELFEEKKEEVKKKPLKSCSSEGSDITSNSSGSYPSNHRYQNCRESDDEVDDVTDCDESDLDDDDEDDDELLEEDYYNDGESYEADNVLDIERIEENSRGSNASGRDRSGYVNAVLNPIENLTQWKAVKSKGRTTNLMQTQSRKENDQEHKLNASFNLEPRVSELPSSSFSLNKKSRDETKKQGNQQVAVDASLSTWLSSSQTTNSGCSSVSMGAETVVSEKNKCMFSYDERPILGALTSKEIKQFSATNSPRKSPSRSPESPIIGTVGGYWNSQSMATRK